MRGLRYTEPFRQDVERLRRRGADFACLRLAVERLAAGQPLAGGYDDRPVPHDVEGLRVCRVPLCGYLLYRVTEREVILVRLFAPLRPSGGGRPGFENERPAGRVRRPVPNMVKSDLKMALRHFRRQKGFAFLNVAGLAVGLAVCLLMFVFVREELSYERFHANADRIVRVVDDEYKEGGIHVHTAATPARLATALAEDFPIVEQTVRFLRYSVFRVPLVTRDGEAAFQEPGFFFADSTVFDVFTFPFVRGDPATALDRPFTVVLTESAARKYFGDEDPLGRTLRFEGLHDFTVTGVMRDLPSNTHMAFDFLASFSSLGGIEGDWIYRYWGWPPMYTYVLLREGARADALAAQLPAFARKRLRADVAARRAFSLQPLTAIHLHSHRENEWTPGSDVAYVNLFSVVAVFILLIACINFTNLATARSAGRAKEVGLRKVIGAQRVQLVRQFLSESMLAAGAGLAAAVGLALLALPAFNDVAGKAFGPADLLGGPVPLVLAAVALATGLLAGGYPAAYLSAFRPARVLKGAAGPGGVGAARFRKALVVFQFAVSCVLLVGTAVVYRQLHFVQHKQLGFDREHVVAAPLAYLAMESWLDGFAYRIRLPWWIFAAAGASALAISFLTVSYQAVRAALADPVRALRYE